MSGEAGAGPIRPVFSADAFTLQRSGGVSRYFAELHRELRAMRVPSEVAAPLWISEHLVAGPGVAGARLPAWADRRGAGRLCRRIGETAERRALQHAASRGGVVLHRTYYAARPRPHAVPTVHTVFDMIHDDHPALTGARDRSAAWKQASLVGSHHIITISEHTRRRLLAHYDLDPNRITTVHLGVSRLEPDRAALAVLSHGDPFLLYVGARSGYKNFDRFLEAASVVLAEREQLRVRVFGGGAVTSAERAAVERLGLHGRVDFATGSDAVLAAHYASAALFVYPSLDEGFGLPPLEAMSLGCPVVSSEGGAMPEILGDAARYFAPTDATAMARAMSEVLDSPELRGRLISRGVDRAREYTWQRVAEETLRVYRYALDARQHELASAT
jgi:glycosyltransferase involved in cell wall biosynthesis